MILIAAAASVIAAILLLATISDVISAGVALWSRTPRAAEPHPQPRLLFLVPAHDEELLIGGCLRSLRHVRYPADRMRIVVVADNCTDGTADAARAAGVACLERVEPALRGKPRALAWAIARVPIDEIDALVIVDADSIVDPGFAQALAAAGPLRHCAAQVYNDVSNPDESALTRMGAVFSAARCRLMNELKRVAGLNVPLANGMCLGADVLRAVGWPAFSLCEDWEMYALLTARGVPIINIPGAHIRSQEARSLRQGAGQRTRWAAGKLTVLRTTWRVLVQSRAIGARQKLDAIAELVAPGPVVQLGMVVGFATACVVLAVPGAFWIAAALGTSQIRTACYTALAIVRLPDRIGTLRAFAFLPIYAIWRLGVQVAALRLAADRAWVRTDRHEH